MITLGEHGSQKAVSSQRINVIHDGVRFRETRQLIIYLQYIKNENVNITHN